MVKLLVHNYYQKILIKDTNSIKNKKPKNLICLKLDFLVFIFVPLFLNKYPLYTINYIVNVPFGVFFIIKISSSFPFSLLI